MVYTIIYSDTATLGLTLRQAIALACDLRNAGTAYQILDSEATVKELAALERDLKRIGRAGAYA